LRCTVGDEATEKAIKMYHIGTAKNGGAIFWQMDSFGKIRTGKIIRYDENGHRRKDVTPPVQWVHITLNLPDFSLAQCFFGEHLLKDTTKPVAIVESEKTAVIASCYLPDFVWLACGGSEGINPDKIGCLKDRTVILFPDVKMFEKWNKKASLLQSVCGRVSVSDLIEKEATEADRNAGCDIADYLIKTPLIDASKSLPDAANTGASNNRNTDNSDSGQTGKSHFETDNKPAFAGIKSEDSLFFENEANTEALKTANLRYKKDRHNIEVWEQEINILEAFFAGIVLPSEPVKLNSFTTLNDVRTFLGNHFATVKANIGNPVFLPYLHRLRELKQLIETL
jgi:hypothetical protein